VSIDACALMQTSHAQSLWRERGMSYNRRTFLTLGAGSVAASLWGTMPLAYGDSKPTIKAIAFDAFTTFDPRPIVALAEQLFPQKGAALGNAWRTRQFEYTWLRSVGHRQTSP
jgi:2-haloacid dehalogenase